MNKGSQRKDRKAAGGGNKAPKRPRSESNEGTGISSSSSPTPVKVECRCVYLRVTIHKKLNPFPPMTILQHTTLKTYWQKHEQSQCIRVLLLVNRVENIVVE